MIASTITGRAAWILSDRDHVRRPETLLLDLIGEAMRQIVLVRPEAGAVTTTMQLAPGSVQTIPTDSTGPDNPPIGTHLLDITRNMGADGATPGAPICRVDHNVARAFTTLQQPLPGLNSISEYSPDQLRPTKFHVYPAVPATSQIHVEIIYAATPQSPIQNTEKLPLDDLYAGPILDFVLYRAFSMDAQSSSALSRANAHYQAFSDALNLRAASDQHHAQPTRRR